MWSGHSTSCCFLLMIKTQKETKQNKIKTNKKLVPLEIRACVFRDLLELILSLKFAGK